MAVPTVMPTTPLPYPIDTATALLPRRWGSMRIEDLAPRTLRRLLDVTLAYSIRDVEVQAGSKGTTDRAAVAVTWQDTNQQLAQE